MASSPSAYISLSRSTSSLSSGSGSLVSPSARAAAMEGGGPL